ncbi:MAG: helix-hairpin-helix domain-containing protein [Thermoplasmata archaeon]
MSRASELIRIFESIADLLELKGEDRFKPAAYRRASRSLESLGEEIEPTAERGALGAIPGVGPAIEAKIREYLTTGSIAYFEALRAEFPAGVLELLKVPGIGPKTARRMLLDLGIDGPTSLLAAIDAGRLAGRAGFGEKKIAALHAALAERIGRVEPAARHPLLIAWELAERVLSELRDRVRVDYLGAAGSLRRGRETVGDLDLLATSSKPAEVFEAFSALPGIRSVRLRGETKETVVFEPGIQIDLRVVAPESLGAALQYFTGSKEHNIRIRSLARELGLKINEYGVFRGDERLPTPREEDLYAALGLSWVPPELREDRGEIEAARAHRIPPIVAPEAIRGDLHLHLPGGVLPDRPPWTAAAGRLGLEYLGWVLAPGEF